MRRGPHGLPLSLVLGAMVICPSFVGARQTPSVPRAVSRAETAALVKADLAKRLKVPAEGIQGIELVNEADRQWTDANLGCPGRKPLGEPLPVPGFAFTLAYQGRQFVYHSDRRGRFRQCDMTKPAGPILR